MTFFGLYRGLVSNDKDPENLNRVKAICPQIFGNETTETDWAWPCYPVGTFTTPVPPAGSPVWLQFVAGDLDYPVWVGTWVAA